jgi:hypothetical protein
MCFGHLAKLAVKSCMFRCESGAHFYARGLFMNSIVAVRGVSFDLSNGRKLFNNLSFPWIGVTFERKADAPICWKH